MSFKKYIAYKTAYRTLDGARRVTSDGCAGIGGMFPVVFLVLLLSPLVVFVIVVGLLYGFVTLLIVSRFFRLGVLYGLLGLGILMLLGIVISLIEGCL